MVINALFTHASCCLLLWLSLIKRDIAKEALFAHCDRRKRSYFVVKDFSLFFFEVLQVLWALWIQLKILSGMESCIKNKPPTCSPSSARTRWWSRDCAQIQWLGLYRDASKLSDYFGGCTVADPTKFSLTSFFMGRIDFLFSLGFTSITEIEQTSESKRGCVHSHCLKQIKIIFVNSLGQNSPFLTIMC